jgi:hypothetical protein
VTKWATDPISGKEFPVEWKTTKGGTYSGAEVSIDLPHLGENGPKLPHIGWQGPKKGSGSGHIFVDFVNVGREK